MAREGNKPPVQPQVTTGIEGKTGPQGPIGPSGPPMARADILAVVEDQFYEIRKRLDLQLDRIGELQVHLDAQRKETARLHDQVDLVHGLMKRLTTSDS